MHKGILSIVAFMLMASVVSAQVPRNPTYNNEGKSNFANVGITGLDVAGNPGYIELNGYDGNGNAVPYYLWVSHRTNGVGILMMASYASISVHASFPTGDWRRPNFGGGQVVGDQRNSLHDPTVQGQ